MNLTNDRLDSETHARIFADKVIPGSGLNEALSHERPKAIILGGQPGAGKGGLAQAAKNQLSGDIVVIDPDELRDYHTGAKGFRSAYPYTWSDHTQAEASKFADELLDATVVGRKNLLFDTTLSNGPWSAELIKDLQAKGYDVEVRVVASPKLESELGVDSRFSKSIEARGYGRYVPEKARKAIYDKLPSSLDTIHAETNVHIRIFNREGKELYNSRTDARSPGQDLIEAREARLQDPAVTRDLKRGWQAQERWHEQLPETITHHPKVAADTAQVLLIERSELNVVEDVQSRTARATSLDYTVRIHPDVMRGIGIVGAAGVAVDATATASRVSDLREQGNSVGAQSEIMHFGGRNLGAWGGAVLGTEVLGAAGVESGPLDVVVAGVGGIAGAFGGEKLAAAYDEHHIYNQADSQGTMWNYDPVTPLQGWTRQVPSGEIGYSPDHPVVGYSVMPEPLMRTIHADPALADRLTFQANNTAVDLALAHPKKPDDPFTQPAAPHDPPSRIAAPWTRDAQTQQWSRTVTDRILEHGLTSTHIEPASAARAAELEAAAQRTMMESLAGSRHGIAERYQAMYEQSGWAKYGSQPEAVTKALQEPTNTLQSSDGHTYSRSAEGQWNTPGMMWGSNGAEGNVRRELNATQRIEQTATEYAHTPDQAKALRPFSDPAHPQHALFAKLQATLPQGTSNERLHQATAACCTADIKLPHQLSGIVGNDSAIYFRSTVLGTPPGQMDMAKPAPTVPQTMQHVQQHDQQQMQMLSQIPAHNAQISQQGSQGITPGGR